MRVGIARFGTISNVTFDVTGANVSPSPTAVIGEPSEGAAPGSAPANSVRISVSNRWTYFAGQRVIVTADSSAGLACSSGPCGSTVIPFSKISWTSSSLATGTYAGQDFGSGSFSGGTNQSLIDFTAPARAQFQHRQRLGVQLQQRHALPRRGLQRAGDVHRHHAMTSRSTPLVSTPAAHGHGAVAALLLTPLPLSLPSAQTFKLDDSTSPRSRVVPRFIVDEAGQHLGPRHRGRPRGVAFRASGLPARHAPPPGAARPRLLCAGAADRRRPTALA